MSSMIGSVLCGASSGVVVRGVDYDFHSDWEKKHATRKDEIGLLESLEHCIDRERGASSQSG